jgi:hypothetical protein
MIICLAFIGILPSYIVECVHQIRCYYDGDVFLIINDLTSVYLKNIEKYNISIIDYTHVLSLNFLDTVERNKNKFYYVDGLTGREDLFIRSFERFFVLKNFLEQNKFVDCLFLELDNLIYDDPGKWISAFSKNELCYMYDNENRFSSGLMYVKNHFALDGVVKCILDFIQDANEFLTEMTTLSIYYEKNKDKVEVLPTYWKSNNVPSIAHLNFDKYNNTIFDALAIGCNLLGLDPFHTKGVIKTGSRSKWSAIDYASLTFEWQIDDVGRKKPYIWTGEKWLLINNLHIHSKDLKNGLSKPIEI